MVVYLLFNTQLITQQCGKKIGSDFTGQEVIIIKKMQQISDRFPTVANFQQKTIVPQNSNFVPRFFQNGFLVLHFGFLDDKLLPVKNLRGNWPPAPRP